MASASWRYPGWPGIRLVNAGTSQASTEAWMALLCPGVRPGLPASAAAISVLDSRSGWQRNRCGVWLPVSGRKL